LDVVVVLLARQALDVAAWRQHDDGLGRQVVTVAASGGGGSPHSDAHGAVLDARGGTAVIVVVAAAADAALQRLVSSGRRDGGGDTHGGDQRRGSSQNGDAQRRQVSFRQHDSSSCSVFSFTIHPAPLFPITTFIGISGFSSTPSGGRSSPSSISVIPEPSTHPPRMTTLSPLFSMVGSMTISPPSRMPSSA